MCSGSRESTSGIGVLSKGDRLPNDARPISERQLGKTGLEVTILGFGTFRTAHVPPADVHRMLDTIWTPAATSSTPRRYTPMRNRRSAPVARRRRGNFRACDQDLREDEGGSGRKPRR